jgi:6-phosphofructokinase 1
VGGIVELGGTILESSRCPEFAQSEARIPAHNHLRSAGIEGLIVIGGNGSQQGAYALHHDGFPVVGVASTIDNDLCGSEITIGADTAINTALEVIDRLRTTAKSHRRVFVVETMGRDCGYLALAAGLAGGAEVIVTPEYDLSPDVVCELIREAKRRGKKHAIVVVAEGAKNDAATLCKAMNEDAGFEYQPKVTVLGYMQRGGKPTAFDRLLATRLAAKASTLLIQGKFGCLVGVINAIVTPTPLGDIAGAHKPLPQDLIDLAATMRL